MPPSIQDILQDVYEADPTLRAQEAELKKTIKAMLKAKPNAEPDVLFVQRLRERVLTEFSSMPKRSSWTSFFQTPMHAALGSAVITAIVIAPLTYTLTRGGNPFSTLTSATQTTRLAERAFGTLNATQQTGKGGSGGGGNRVAMDAALSSVAPVAEGTSEKMMPPDAAMDSYIMEPMDITKYIYHPPTIPEIEDVANVYRRNASSISLPSFSNVTFNGVSLSAFSNLSARSVSLKENRKNGYELTLNADDGSLYIGQNWEQWTQPSDWSPLSAEDMLTEEQTVNAANAFAAQYKLPTERFGTPIVQNNDIRFAATSVARGEMAYYPEMVNVIYPMTIQGVPVWEEYGAPYGMTISVSMRTKQVISANIPAITSLDTSSYDLETNTERLTSIVERGGLYEWVPEQATQTVDVELEDAEQVYMFYSRWVDNKNEVLFVPALRFHIGTSSDDQPVWKSQVIIPLVKDLLDEQQQPTIRPFDVMETPAVNPMIK